MRDLTHATFSRTMLADLTRPDAGPGKPVDGDPADPVARVPPEDGNGPVRAPQQPEPIRAETLFMPGNHRAYETVLRLARETHALIWDAALAVVRAAPPMPLESPDPWFEDANAYRHRLDSAHPQNDHWSLDLHDLLDVGWGYGLPRARLVRVDGA